MVQRENTPDTDDVNGHMPRIRLGVTEEASVVRPEDVEGHATRPGRAQEEPDDTEGHGVRVRF